MILRIKGVYQIFLLFETKPCVYTCILIINNNNYNTNSNINNNKTLSRYFRHNVHGR